MLDGLAEENMHSLILFIAQKANIDLPSDLETVRFSVWVLIRRGFVIPQISASQLYSLQTKFALTNYTDKHDDTPITSEGSHRALNNFLSRELGESVPETRRAVYSLAKAIVYAER
jgi:hypothetical protein